MSIKLNNRAENFQNRHVLEIIKDEEDEEDKESVVQFGNAQEIHKLMLSNETFDLKSPLQKRIKFAEHQENKLMPYNIQS